MNESHTLTIRRFQRGSVFRIVAAGAFLSLVCFSCLMGVFALFGFDTVTWNREPITGLLASPLIGILAAALFTAFFGLSFGLWLYSRLRPLTLHVVDEPANGPNQRIERPMTFIQGWHNSRAGRSSSSLDVSLETQHA